MNVPEERAVPQPSPADDTYVENLEALTRDLDDIEALAAAALDGQSLDQGAADRISHTPTGLTYDELTQHNQQRREAEAWGDAELADILDPTALRQLDEWRTAQRIRWERSDLVVVGAAGLLGALADLYDTQLDAKVLEGLAWLKKTDLITRWEQDATGMPIDYMGPKFGGPGHRGLSAGHDIGRFFNALNQVRTGTFEGTYWEYGERFAKASTTTPFGTPYSEVEWPLALAQLLKHWVADFVTPMSLPLARLDSPARHAGTRAANIWPRGIRRRSRRQRSQPPLRPADARTRHGRHRGHHSHPHTPRRLPRDREPPAPDGHIDQADRDAAGRTRRRRSSQPLQDGCRGGGRRNGRRRSAPQRARVDKDRHAGAKGAHPI